MQSTSPVTKPEDIGLADRYAKIVMQIVLAMALLALLSTILQVSACSYQFWKLSFFLRHVTLLVVHP